LRGLQALPDEAAVTVSLDVLAAMPPTLGDEADPVADE